MKNKISSLRLISLIVFLLIAGTAVLFMAITYYSAKQYHQATTQLLNREVAEHIAKFTSPYQKKGINKAIADSVFHNAMVLSPSIEVYFLDTNGRVMYYDAPDKDIVQWTVPLDPLNRYIASEGKKFITGIDPRDPDEEKIFSAAKVNASGRYQGYIYVILGSKEFRLASNILYNSHIGNLLLQAFMFVVISSIIITWLYLRRVEKRFHRMIGVLERFKKGDYNARFQKEKNSEFSVFTESFNNMAELLVRNIVHLKQSEEGRKQLIVNISHDLRTPLSIARGYAETLSIKKSENQNLPDKQDHYIDLVIQKITQVEHMVTQLFELSRIESGEIVPHKQPFIFSEIVFEVMNSLMLPASHKNITIECAECSDFSWIDADIKMMESVVQNIIINAISYTKEKNIICVSMKQIENELVFVVENPADPLPDDVLAWINAGSHGDGDSRPQKSMIGLSIVKRIIHLHHFDLLVTSVNGYNTFRIIMPLFRNIQENLTNPD